MLGRKCYKDSRQSLAFLKRQRFSETREFEIAYNGSLLQRDVDNRPEGINVTYAFFTSCSPTAAEIAHVASSAVKTSTVGHNACKDFSTSNPKSIRYDSLQALSTITMEAYQKASVTFLLTLAVPGFH